MGHTKYYRLTAFLFPDKQTMDCIQDSRDKMFLEAADHSNLTDGLGDEPCISQLGERTLHRLELRLFSRGLLICVDFFPLCFHLR